MRRPVLGRGQCSYWHCFFKSPPTSRSIDGFYMGLWFSWIWRGKNVYCHNSFQYFGQCEAQWTFSATNFCFTRLHPVWIFVLLMMFRFLFSSPDFSFVIICFVCVFFCFVHYSYIKTTHIAQQRKRRAENCAKLCNFSDPHGTTDKKEKKNCKASENSGTMEFLLENLAKTPQQIFAVIASLVSQSLAFFLSLFCSVQYPSLPNLPRFSCVSLLVFLIRPRHSKHRFSWKC